MNYIVKPQFGIRYDLITGPTGCGKSTLARLICEHLADPPREGAHPLIGWQDTSECIEQSRKRDTSAGRELIEARQKQAQGYVLDAKPVYDSIMEYIASLRGSGALKNFIIAGSPRTPQESMLFLKSGKLLHVFLVECTEEEVRAGVRRRVLQGGKRIDDAETVLERKFKEYREKVLPAIKILEKEGLVTRLKRSWPLARRIETVVSNMLIPEHVREKWRRKLDTGNHPIHAAIKEIEEGPKNTAENSPAESVRRDIPAPGVMAYA